MTTAMEQARQTSALNSGSAEYLEHLFELYLQNPANISLPWREYFDRLPKSGIEVSHAEVRNHFIALTKQNNHPTVVVKAEHDHHELALFNLIHAYQRLGHCVASLDPLQLQPQKTVPELDFRHYGFTSDDLTKHFSVPYFQACPEGTLQNIIDTLKNVYCHTLGIEYLHIQDTTKVAWLKNKIESNWRKNLSTETRLNILNQLIAAEGLEKYLGSKYVGQKRFSLEGGDSLIPMLDGIIMHCTQYQVKDMVIGMAHRGRLNLLVNLLGKSPADLFAEFEGKKQDSERSGDVKYHMGFSCSRETLNGNLHVALGFNPSHLEIINPVVEGSVRARQDRYQDGEHRSVLPVLVHGDAAFIGQGVVMETFSLSQVNGYRTGGSIHIVVNNQVGFTTDASDARSSAYATDIAKMIDAPIFHVNGDDPEAAYFVGLLALQYRFEFQCDVVIDLVCYRRHGHNEADEPAITQPLMYQIVRQHPTTVALYAALLQEQNVLSETALKEKQLAYRDRLDSQQEVVEIQTVKPMVDWRPHIGAVLEFNVDTHFPQKSLEILAQQLTTIPGDLNVQAQVAKEIENRRKMASGEQSLNWGFAETLAYATLLQAGYHVRLSGQDVERGTFSHRHVVWHDQQDNHCHVPLRQINEKQGVFSVYNSILSEAAVLGFEYGYATADPTTLVIWEAQYGDFANGAQVVIDQFISSGEQKWGRLCGLTLFLPHGYEGQGPEHTSARLERYLQLCAEKNMQICAPTTPAQIFHLLRRQMIQKARKPLVVLTPKSLLRHKLAVSSLAELAQSSFQTVLMDPSEKTLSAVKRIVICSGRIFYDLYEAREARGIDNVLLLRVEQLYPFPTHILQAALAKYKNVKDIMWCQEEPRNQGSWYQVRHRLEASLQDNQQLDYAGRRRSASPAVGSAAVHKSQQQEIIDKALIV